jgi:hypothetical protein
VRDNIGAAASYYNRATLETTGCGMTPCRWDSNGDGVRWVRSSATIRGRTRSIVSLVRQQVVRLPIPRTTITAGRVTTTNQGRKVIIDTRGCKVKTNPSPTCNTTQPAPVVVRCTSGTGCLDYRAEQIAPNVVSQDAAAPNLLTPAQLDMVRTFAIQAGTYRNSCPVNPADMAGQIVFIEPPSAAAAALNCTFGSNGTTNSASAPGIVVINRGSLAITGDYSYYGVIYAANNLPATGNPNSSSTLVAITGGAYIQGGIFVDGMGGVSVGSSGLNVSFDENAYGNLKGVSGNAALVQSTYRELPAGQ